MSTISASSPTTAQLSGALLKELDSMQNQEALATAPCSSADGAAGNSINSNGVVQQLQLEQNQIPNASGTPSNHVFSTPGVVSSGQHPGCGISGATIGGNTTTSSSAGLLSSVSPPLSSDGSEPPSCNTAGAQLPLPPTNTTVGCISMHQQPPPQLPFPAGTTGAPPPGSSAGGLGLPPPQHHFAYNPSHPAMGGGVAGAPPPPPMMGGLPPGMPPTTLPPGAAAPLHHPPGTLLLQHQHPGSTTTHPGHHVNIGGHQHPQPQYNPIMHNLHPQHHPGTMIHPSHQQHVNAAMPPAPAHQHHQPHPHFVHQQAMAPVPAPHQPQLQLPVPPHQQQLQLPMQMQQPPQQNYQMPAAQQQQFQQPPPQVQAHPQQHPPTLLQDVSGTTPGLPLPGSYSNGACNSATSSTSSAVSTAGGMQPGGELETKVRKDLQIPQKYIGLMVGIGGQTLWKIKKHTQTEIYVSQDSGAWSTAHIAGTAAGVDHAVTIIHKMISSLAKETLQPTQRTEPRDILEVSPQFERTPGLEFLGKGGKGGSAVPHFQGAPTGQESQQPRGKGACLGGGVGIFGGTTTGGPPAYVDARSHRCHDWFEVPQKYLGLLIGKHGDAIKRYRHFAAERGMAIVVQQSDGQQGPGSVHISGQDMAAIISLKADMTQNLFKAISTLDAQKGIQSGSGPMACSNGPFGFGGAESRGKGGAGGGQQYGAVRGGNGGMQHVGGSPGALAQAQLFSGGGRPAAQGGKGPQQHNPSFNNRSHPYSGAPSFGQPSSTSTSHFGNQNPFMPGQSNRAPGPAGAPGRKASHDEDVGNALARLLSRGLEDDKALAADGVAVAPGAGAAGEQQHQNQNTADRVGAPTTECGEVVGGAEACSTPAANNVFMGNMAGLNMSGLEE